MSPKQEKPFSIYPLSSDNMKSTTVSSGGGGAYSTIYGAVKTPKLSSKAALILKAIKPKQYSI
jgi:hypothetical protein